MVGDPCVDVGFFAAYHQPAGEAIGCARAVASALGYDEHRAVSWAAVWLVHQACESWRDDSEAVFALAAGRALAEILLAE
jgi:streptomycin 6-kinase